MGAGAPSLEVEASSSPEIGESSSKDGALPQDARVSFSGVKPAVSPGDAHYFVACKDHRWIGCTIYFCGLNIPWPTKATSMDRLHNIFSWTVAVSVDG